MATDSSEAVHTLWLKSWEDTGETEIYSDSDARQARRLRATRALVPDSVLQRFRKAEQELEAAEEALWACAQEGD